MCILIEIGDEEALNTLVNANLRFVISVAKEYQGQGVPLVDLISEGNYGLVKAAKKFDHTRGFRFISYAVWWVRQSILQSLCENSRTVRLPVNIVNQLSSVKKEMAKFEQENQRPATQSDMDLSVLNHPTCGSLNEKINEDGVKIKVSKLEKKEKIGEIARMLSGKEITDEAVNAAIKLMEGIS